MHPRVEISIPTANKRILTNLYSLPTMSGAFRERIQHCIILKPSRMPEIQPSSFYHCLQSFKWIKGHKGWTKTNCLPISREKTTQQPRESMNDIPRCKNNTTHTFSPFPFLDFWFSVESLYGHGNRFTTRVDNHLLAVFIWKQWTVTFFAKRPDGMGKILILNITCLIILSCINEYDIVQLS